MSELKKNTQRAKNAITLIWIVLLLEFISLISKFFQLGLLQNVANGNYVSIEALNANDTREQIIAVFYLIAMLISIITFIQWFRRAYYNLHIKVKNLSYSEGWAAGSWFVPVISLFRPFQIMKELYLETHNLLVKNKIILNHKLKTNFLVVWWTLWILDNIIGQINYRYSIKAETIEELTNNTLLSIVSNVIGIVLAFATVRVIKEYESIAHLLKEINTEITSREQLSL